MSQAISTPTVLDPNLVNLHRQFGISLANLAPLIANEVKISIGQAKMLITHAIDAVVIFLLKTQKDAPKSPNPSISARFHQQLHGSRLDTVTLKNLKIQDADRLFGDKNDEVITRLSTLCQVAPATATQVANIVASLCQHHLEVLAADGKLEYGEKKEWLAMQSLFLAQHPPAKTWATIAQYDLTAPTLKKGEVRVKLGTKESSFDQSKIALPNLVWLISLAQITEQKYQKPLTIGQIAHPHDPIFDERVRTAMAELSATITNDPKSLAKSAKLPKKEIAPAPNNRFAWLVSGAVMATAVGVFALPKLFVDKALEQTIATKVAPTPKKSDTTIQGIGHQDIAVVRIKDDEASKTAVKTNDKTNDKPNNKSDKASNKSAQQDTKAVKTLAEKPKTEPKKEVKSEKTAPTVAKAKDPKTEKQSPKPNKVAEKSNDKADARPVIAKASTKTDNKVDARRANNEKADNKSQKTDNKTTTSNKTSDKVANTPKTQNTSTTAKVTRSQEPKQGQTQAKQTTPKTEQKTTRPTKTQNNPALTTMQVNATPAEKPKPTTPAKVDDSSLSTLKIEQSTRPVNTEQGSTNNERKNKNRNTGEPIINQDTIGKIGDGNN